MFKHYIDEARLLYLHPLVISIMFDMKFYCDENKIPFIITSTVSTVDEDQEINRRSSTHRTGRAFDASLKGWSEKELIDFKKHFNNKYKHVAAVDKKGRPKFIVDHVGTARHLHIQIHSRYARNYDSLPLE